MTVTSAQTSTGSGITVVEAPSAVVDAVETEEVLDSNMLEVEEFYETPADVTYPEPVAVPVQTSGSLSGEAQALLDAMSARFDRAIADVEFRLAQTYELQSRAAGAAPDKVYVEDIVSYEHRLTGFQMLSNSNGTTTLNGSIAWKSLHVVYLGVDYTIADGTTANKYAWFVKPASGTTATLATGDTLPVLGPDDTLVFVNSGGVAVDATATNIPYVVAPGTVTASALASDVNTVLSGLRTDLTTVQNQADGAITSWFQNTMPWPEGAGSSPARDANTGDVWYDSDDGGAFRWTGPAGTKGDGTPWANKWLRIADTDTSALAGLVNTKVTTYVGTSSPVAPTGGFTIGDMWINTTGGANVLNRWQPNPTTPAWVQLQFGDAAISGVGATKISGILAAANIPTIDLATKVSGTLNGANVGTGINATNVTTGTLAGARVGAGVNAANVDNGTMSGARVGAGVNPSVLTGTGQVPVAGIPTLTPAKLNAAFHMLY